MSDFEMNKKYASKVHKGPSIRLCVTKKKNLSQLMFSKTWKKVPSDRKSDNVRGRVTHATRTK